MEMKATGKLRELQLVEAEILHDFKLLCEKNGLRYFLEYGTLLGAVRHKGFIPWDDDIDISMPYEDYKKFLEIAQEQFGEKYFVQTCETDRNYYRLYARIRKNGTTCMDDYQRSWDIHHGVWVDIFPIIEVNSGFDKKFKKALVQLSNFVLMDNFFDIHTDEFTERYGKIFVGLIKTIHKISWSKRLKLSLKLQKYICQAKNKKYKAALWMSITDIFLPEIIESSCKLEFEGEEYDVPCDYKRRLEIVYGDYMQLPPEGERKGHGGNMIIDLENDYTMYVNKRTTDT